ncbi:hypothetical protein [uncultured Ruminococcus sp.]|uniref:hypothetical protein n=1 Tax=uncultured Ruminococcus sp. TaxID=165186 RepID=UPI00261D58C6|nr:hypothetical protein [uncultured Ruminococcus sp.]
MDFRDQFRKMSDDVGKMAKEVADSSKKATARARIRRMINSCNESLETIYKEIGSRYYVENQCDPGEQYAGLFQQAADLIAQMDVLKSELAGLDNATICPSCGSKVNDLQKFCPECGCKNTSYGKWKAEAEAEEAARRAAKEAEQAERAARKAEKAAQAEVYETTAEAVPTDDTVPPVDATVSMEEE